MATVQELKDKVSNAEFNLNFRKGGNQNSRRGPDGLMPLGGIDFLLEENIKKQERFKAAGNQFELENQQRIYRNLISERLQQERVIAQREIELAALKQELEVAVSNQAQQDAAKGQTATAPTTNGEPVPVAVPVTNEQQAKLDQSRSGELSSKVEQSQDPIAANKQNNQNGTAQPKSEANFSGETNQNAAASVSGNNNVSGKKSDFAPQSAPGYGLPKNKLHDYTSYTYRITLFLLTKKDFNELASNPTKFVPTFSLISSGGGFAAPGSIKTETTRKVSPFGGYEDVSTTQTKAGRHPDFQTDFFIDNLQIQTVVGLNAKSKASNAIDISFNITEPYGLSLLDRLLSASETCGDKNANYMEQPYLLQVDLLASPTDEQLGIMKQSTNVIDSKKIAIKLLEMKIKPSGSGSTYAIKAMPYNHVAFSLTTAAMPITLSVEASTVGEFFSSADDIAKIFSGQNAINEERLESELKAWIDEFWSTGGFQPTPEQIANQRKALQNAIVYNSKSLAAGYNGYMDKVAKDQKLSRLPPTKIAFNIPDRILSESPIVDEKAQVTDGKMQDPTTTVGKVDPQLKKTQSFTINAGTSIIDVIDMIMGKSEYVKSQIKTLGKTNNNDAAQKEYTNDRERANADKQLKALTLKWYKVVPTVALNDFDATRNAYSKTILYTILPYTGANAYHPNFPQSTAQTLENSVVREYNYLYTGKNQDILRLDIDFDSTFYTQLTTKPLQVAVLGTDRNSDIDDVNKNQAQYSVNTPSNPTNPPTSYQISGQQRRSNSLNSSNNPDEQIVNDLKQSIYTSQRGDALNIKLQIIGDPDFIKQDDIFYNPGSPEEYAKTMGSRLNNSSAPINESGQILFDAEQVYVKLTFRNAVDINDKIGIVNKQDKLTNGRMTNGSFSGIYKIQTVESEFSRGQFTQTLDLIRMPESLPEIKIAAPQTTQSGISTDTQSAKKNEEADNSKQNAVSANPTGLAPPVPPKLAEAAAQPAANGQGGPENAGNNQAVAPQVSAGFTFAEAFRQARKDFGNRPGGVFEWRGKLYQTNYQNEPLVKNPIPVYPGANQ